MTAGTDGPPELHPQLVAELSKAWDDWNAKNVALWPGTPNEDPKPAAKKKP